MAYALNSNALGKVGKVRSTKKEKGYRMPIPFSNSNATLVYSFEGATREFILNGVYTSSDGTVDTFIDTIEALVDGAQGGTDNYSLTTGATDLPASLSIIVHVEEFTWEWANDFSPSGDAITYTIKLLERA